MGLGIGRRLRRAGRSIDRAAHYVGSGVADVLTQPGMLATDPVGAVVKASGYEGYATDKAKQEAKDKARKAEAARQAAITKNLEMRRKGLRLRGAASTRISGTTPDLFATIGGQRKQLLG